MPKAASSNFSKLTAADTYRLICRSWGPDKSGKNHFGFTGPGPIYGQYFDPGGTEGVAQKFIRGDDGVVKREIHACYYRFRKGATTQADAIELRDQFVDDYHEALKHARTVQWDETELWELCRHAAFDGDSDAPKNYNALNAFYRGLIQDAYDSGVNLQLIQKVKERWTTNAKGSPVPSGVFEPTGFKEANYIVQVNLRHSWDKDRGFVLDIVNCRQNMALAGETFANTTFGEIAGLIFPESSEGDWE